MSQSQIEIAFIMGSAYLMARSARALSKLEWPRDATNKTAHFLFGIQRGGHIGVLIMGSAVSFAALRALLK